MASLGLTSQYRVTSREASGDSVVCAMREGSTDEGPLAQPGISGKSLHLSLNDKQKLARRGVRW